ncbi:MAG: hypothetical protein LC745_01915, partial [Planctomycetia bacterium]|nr:hypothetical protein [Planctomycetia bacterium]
PAPPHPPLSQEIPPVKAIYSALFAVIDAKSGFHTFLAALGLIGLAAWQFSQNDPESGVKSATLGLGMLGIGMKQHATSGEVAKVVDATAPEATKAA